MMKYEEAMRQLQEIVAHQDRRGNTEIAECRHPR